VVKKSTGIGVTLVAMTVAMAVPPIIANALGQSALAGALILPVMASLLPALLADVRTALFAAGGLAVGSTAAATVAGDPLLAALVMAATALLVGLACRWGRSKNLILVPITVGFVVCVPPATAADLPVQPLLLGAASLAAALWGTAVGSFLGKRMPKTPPQPEIWPRVWAYAIVLAILTGIAAGISVATDWGHAGGWFILTVVLVFQPYLQDSFRRTGQRAVGTVIGVIGAYVVHLLLPWSTVEIVVGAVLMVTAVIVAMNPKYPYWFFTALLTPAIVLLAGSSSDFTEVATSRLLATLAGAALSLAAALLLAPIYRSGAKKHGHARY
jgi:hypothetical protein